MSKEISINIEKSFLEIIIKPIRKKEDIIRLLLETIRFFLIGYSHKNDEFGKIIIKINKMSRVIYQTKNKIFSINFPFSIKENGKLKYEILDTTLKIQFDNKIISSLIELLNEGILDENYLIDFLDKIDQIEQTLNYNDDNKIWKLLKKLLFLECGYLRFDYDEEYQNGDYHPINHYDIYYSNSNTFKLGLNETIDVEKFIDLLDITTPCHFIK